MLSKVSGFVFRINFTAITANRCDKDRRRTEATSCKIQLYFGWCVRRWAGTETYCCKVVATVKERNFFQINVYTSCRCSSSLRAFCFWDAFCERRKQRHILSGMSAFFEHRRCCRKFIGNYVWWLSKSVLVSDSILTTREFRVFVFEVVKLKRKLL